MMLSAVAVKGMATKVSDTRTYQRQRKESLSVETRVCYIVGEAFGVNGVR